MLRSATVRRAGSNKGLTSTVSSAQVLPVHNDPVDVDEALKIVQGVLGMCSGGPLTPATLELLNASDDEIARLKREYLPRRRN